MRDAGCCRFTIDMIGSPVLSSWQSPRWRLLLSIRSIPITRLGKGRGFEEVFSKWERRVESSWRPRLRTRGETAG